MSAPRPSIGPARTAAATGSRVLLAALLFAVPLLFSTHTVEAFEFPKVLALQSVAALLIAGVLAHRLGPALRQPGEAWRSLTDSLRGDVLAWAALTYLLSAALSTVLSISPHVSLRGAHESFFGLGTAAAYVVVFFAARACVRAGTHLAGLLPAALLGAGGAAAYALVQAAGRDPIRWTRTHEFHGLQRVFGTLGNPVLLGAFLSVALPLALGFALRGWRRQHVRGAWPPILLALLLLSALLASLSRAAWLAAAAGLVVFAAGAVASLADAARRRRAALVVTALALASAVGVAALPSGRAVVGAMWQRLTLTIETRASDTGAVPGLALKNESRPLLWSAAWHMFRDHPWVGVGQDAFQLAYQRYRQPGVWALEGHYTPSKAHNELLHVLATQGLLGGAACLLGFVGLLAALRRAWRAPAGEPELLIGVAAALAAFLVQAQFAFVVAAGGTLAAVLAGSLCGLGRPPQARVPADSLRPAMIGAALAVAAVGAALWFGVLQPLRADLAAQRGVVARKANAPGAAAPEFEAATRLNPRRDLHWVQLGVAHYELAQALRGVPERAGQLAAARAAFERAAKIEPRDSFHQGSLARALAEISLDTPGDVQPEQALAAFERAMELDPNNPYWPSEAGRFALDLRHFERAGAWAQRALKIDPQNGPAAWLQGSLELEGALPFLATSANNPTRRELFGVAGNMLRDAAIFKRWYGDDGLRAVCASQAGAALLLAGRLDEARQLGELATQIDPRQPDARYNLGKTYESLGDVTRARHEYRQALTFDPRHERSRRALAEIETRLRGPAPSAAPR